ncbi:trypsin-like serine peptidase [Alicycliphilus denitrificans]|uniref:trypsin-like serine peptidase n=1 Tax=Alicycliphilus denitrificans TaxID=179636 RepID=UPI003A7FDFBD
MRISGIRWAALPMALALAACGGGSGSSDSGGGSSSGTPEAPAWSERIEPYDPGKAGSAAKAAAQQSSALADPADTRAVTLGPLPESIAKAAAGAPAAPGVPRQIGQPRSVAGTAGVAATAALLRWRPAPDGTQVAALRFESQGARGVRLGVLVQALPPGAVLRFYGAARDEAVEVGAQELQDVAERNARAGAADAVARTYWSPDFGGPQTTLEVQIPSAASPAAVRLAVPGLSHFTVSPAEAEGGVAAKALGDAGSCEIDVSCDAAYLEQSRSVARMTYVDETGASFYCTGTLLNDAASSGTPYFLGANHCISTQAVASTLVTDWLFRAASCGSGVNSGAWRLTGGATLLYASAATDTSFMRLNRQAPAGIVYAGSYYGGVPAGTALASVHHPEGDLQKLSLGTLRRYGNCSGGSCGASDSGSGGFLVLDWQQGSTERGSSGAAAFITIGGRRYVTGQLYGGTASCTAPSGVDYFGRFDLSYRAALYKWLNPGR